MAAGTENSIEKSDAKYGGTRPSGERHNWRNKEKPRLKLRLCQRKGGNENYVGLKMRKPKL